MVHLNMQGVASKFGRVVSRKKTDSDVDGGLDGGAQLPRVLGLFDLTLLGVGSTLGVGVYVLAGEVAKENAGPAVTLSFAVAAFASALAGLCYAEFAARVPKAGSAYVYSYVTVGELAAFVIGWNLILEYIIGTASVARAFSNYLDNMMGNVMNETLSKTFPMHVPFLSPYPDFLSLGIVLLLTVLLAYGVKESALMNNIFTALNLFTVATVIGVGLFKADLGNWNIPKDKIPAGKNGGEGGFLPFGISGVMAGAAKCFFGFVGFDCVATTGEEAKNPQRHIPLAIVISLIIIFLSYFGVSSVVTLMVAYYDQNTNAPLVVAFEDVGMDVISKIVSVGAIFALCTSLLGCAFPLPRVLYAMGNDGLLPQFFCRINEFTQSPLSATLVSGVFAGIMAAIFELEQLVNMMSIGTLLAYSIVALCVLLLRYRDPKPALYHPDPITAESRSPSQYLGSLLNLTRISSPDKATTRVSEVAVFLFVAMVFATTTYIVSVEDQLNFEMNWQLYGLIILGVTTCLPVLVIALQPQDNPNIFFKVPWIPLIPCVSIFMNVYLMMKLDVNTWIRFSVWLFIGGLIYVFYSIPNSLEGQKDRLARANENDTKLRSVK
ncbi:cationic amino acid transporter [Nesidiocoris tenuis]|uniref:Cationic amino acid transporter n=1 Tax=Nesidiocoris tenuis TaxID=355587 RepID=A0ABN7AWC4_9HEMI|nr:cationic amino acid transporter [Nesidiocoris tenuis]